MAKFNPGTINLPPGITVGQAMSQGLLNANTVVLTGYAPSTGLNVAVGGVDSVQGFLGSVSALVGGAAIGDNPAVNPGAGGTPTNTGVGSAGSNTLAQLMSSGAIQQSDLCSTLTFCAVVGGD